MRAIYPAKDFISKILARFEPVLINQDVEVSLQTLDESIEHLFCRWFFGAMANEDPGLWERAFRHGE